MPYRTYTTAGLSAMATDCDEVEALVDASKSLCTTTDTYQDNGVDYTYVTMCGAYVAGVVPGQSFPACTVCIETRKQMYRVITAAAFLLSHALTSPLCVAWLAGH